MTQDCAAGTIPRARLKQRQLFDVARSGDARSFQFLLQNSKVEYINFQYSAIVAEGGGSNLWPWYWCIDACDSITRCWGAPAGIEPEAGDTLLMITLKLGMEEHVKSILETRTVSLGIRNFSGRDAAGIATSCGRELLIPHPPRRGEGQQQGPKARARAARRRREQRRIRRLGTSRAMKNADRLLGNSVSVSPSVPFSHIRGYPSADWRPTRDTAAGGLLDEGLNESVDYQRIGVSGELFQAASKGAFGAAVIAGMLRRQQQSDHEHTDDGSAPQHLDGETNSSFRIDGTNTKLAELVCDVHPSPSETRAVGVQTDPERDFSKDTAAPTAVPGKAQHMTGCRTPGVVSPVRLGGNTHDARLHRRSSAPGDFLSHSRDAPRPTPSSAGPAGFGGGQRSSTWQHSCHTDPDTTSPLQREGMELGLPVSDTADENQAGPISTNLVFTELHPKGSEKPATAPVDKRESLRCGNGDDTKAPAPPGVEDLVLRQHGLLGRGGGDSTYSGDGDSPPCAVDPVLAKRRAVDEITRQLQEILREDALQDDGTLDYSAAFELFDVDHDGNATPDELHAVFLRLGMGNLLDEEGMAMVVDRVPRNSSGLVTQHELQQFADRPAGVPWSLHRGSSGRVEGCEDVQRAESAWGFTVVLHELQVNAVPRVGGVFSWKKAPKDLSSVSLFARITRGLHVVESAPVLSSLLPLGGDNSVGRNIDDVKHSAAAWSWQWEEALAVPALEVAGMKGENKREAYGEGDEKEGHLADSRLAAVYNNKGCKSSNRDSGTKVTTTQNTPLSKGASTRVAIFGDDAADDLQHDGDPSSCEVDATVDRSRGDSTDSSESRWESASVVDDRSTDGGPAVAADAAFPKADNGPNPKRGVSFWSPRKGRRNTDAAAARDNKTSGVCTINHDDRGAVSATLDGTVVTGDERPATRGSSIGSETSESDKRQRPRLRKARERKSVRRSTSSDQICPELLVKVGDTVVVEGAVAGERAETEANDGVTTTKKAMSFWGPRRGRRNRHTFADTATIDEPDSQALSRCDSEASTVFDTSDPQDDGDGTPGGTTKSCVPDDESGAAKVPHDSLNKKKGGSFRWSPRRGRRNTDAAARDRQTSGVCTSQHDDTEVKTALDAEVVPGDERPATSGSSIGSETSESDTQQRFRLRKARDGKSVRHSNSSGQICPEVLVKVGDTVVGERAVAVEVADAQASDGVNTRKKAVSFWGPRRGRRNRHTSADTATIEEPDSQALSRCDSEASTVFDISDPEDDGDGTVTATDKTEGLVPADESGMANAPRDILHKTTGGSFHWSPRRKGKKSAKKTEADGRARGDSDGTATTGLHLVSAEAANNASYSREQSARRRRRVPWKGSTATSDVMLLEIWEVKGAAVSSPCPTNEADATAPGCGVGETAVDVFHARGPEETNGCNQPHLDEMEEGSDRLGSGDGPLSAAKASEHAPPLGATVETTGGPQPACDDNVDSPATARRDTDSTGSSGSATEEGCVDDDRTSVGDGDGVSDEASVASTTPMKSPRRKRLSLLPSLLKGRRAKGEGPSKHPSIRPPVGSSERESPRGSALTVNGENIAEGQQQEVLTVCEKVGRETSDAALDSRASDLAEGSSTDDEDADGDASAAANQAQRGRSKATFLSSYKGRKTAIKDSSPRSAAKAKPVLWGRLTVRVADVLLAGRGRSSSGDDRLVDGQNVPVNRTNATQGGVVSPDCLQVRSSMPKDGEGSWSSAFGMSLTRRGPKRRAREKDDTLGFISACDELDDSASGLSPRATDSYAVDGWFEVEHPKGKRGKRAKGRVRLTITCLEPPASSEYAM